MYLVTYTRPDLRCSNSYLLQFLGASSMSHLMGNNHILVDIKGPKNSNLSLPYLNASEMTIEGYTDCEYGYFLETRQSISGKGF
jgi:hypothetical protein